MIFVPLGSTGIKVSRICFGTMTYGSKHWREWVLEEEEAKPFYRRAFEQGINFFDSADMYSLGRAEEILGNAVREFGTGRDKLILATKVFNPMSDDPNDRGLSRKHIMKSVDRSLQRLQTDYIDLYQIHRFDYDTPIEETLAALDSLVQSGKVRYLGASSMFAWQFAKMLFAADSNGWQRFVTMQNHYNLIYREEEREMLPLCRDQGVGVIPWSPLARGFLAGNRPKGDEAATVRGRTDEYSHKLYTQDNDWAIVDQVSAMARRRGVPNAQVALAWLLAQPGVTAPIVGASKMNHLDDAVAALDVKLDEAELKELGEGYQPHPILGHG